MYVNTGSDVTKSNVIVQDMGCITDLVVATLLRIVHCVQDALQATGNGGNETPDHEACIHRLQADLSMALAELEKEHALTSQKEIAIVEHEALIRNYEGQVCAHSA